MSSVLMTASSIPISKYVSVAGPVFFYYFSPPENIYVYRCISHWKHVSLKITLVLRLIWVLAEKTLLFCVCPNYPALRIICTGSLN